MITDRPSSNQGVIVSTATKYHLRTGSNASNPDMNWSQAQETITMLALAVAQIETTLTEGSRSVGELTESFTTIAKDASHIKKVVSEITPDTIGTAKESVETAVEDISSRIHQAVVAFQFYDRISQKLDHVCDSMEHLGKLISDPEQLCNPRSWSSLQSNIKSSYSMEAERLMFEYILRGHPIEEALEVYRHHFLQEREQREQTNDGEDSVELF